tara:strand:- start:546 stop:1136 length:591 start_codon:yes stop_codon:yes gene_type:complete
MILKNTKNSFITYNLNNQSGMTLVEMVISITLLSIFFISYSGFVEISSRFNNKEIDDLSNSNGLLIDHHYLFLTLEKYSDFLSQAGVTLSDINNIRQIQTGVLPAGCSFSPQIEWQLPIKQKPINDINWQPSNAGYAICLKSTSIIESSLTDLISKSKGNSLSAQPGLYFLIALPDEVSINALPVRKLFCRPQPFC